MSSRLFALVGVVGCLVAPVIAQSIAVDTAGGAVRVRSGFTFIEGAVLERLRDGRSVRANVELAVRAAPGGAVLASSKESFNLSFDLWEERLAVTRMGSPARSVSHLRPRDAEAWCLQGVVIARGDLNKLGADEPFWVRVSVQVPDLASPPDADGDDIFTIRRLIDVFSRRAQDGDLVKVVEAGPFRLAP